MIRAYDLMKRCEYPAHYNRVKRDYLCDVNLRTVGRYLVVDKMKIPHLV